MILVYCPICLDIFKLRSDKVLQCNCGSSYGFHIGGSLEHQVGGKAIKIKIDDDTFLKALQMSKIYSKDVEFKAVFMARKLHDSN